ncbi:MAG: TonB-dependent receptor [Tannerella sp.]|nr:TonB-dependent receptor [Tannerella sp.]
MKQHAILPLLLWGFLFFTSSLFAQTGKAAYSLKGQLVDSLTQETLPYATLGIASTTHPEKTIAMMAADGDGLFTLPMKAPGTYIVTFQSVGMKTKKVKVTLTAKAKVLDLGKILMDDEKQALGNVTVTAQKPLVKIDLDKITYSLQEDPESQTNNTLDMLRKVPMVTVDGEDNIQLKGSSNFKIYLNGKPSNMLSSSNASDVLKSMPASQVKNIEVITDPGAKYDAEGVGGIINIITVKNAMQGYTGTVNATVSALGRAGAGAYFTTKIGKLGLTANYNYNYQHNPWTESHYENTQYGTYGNTERGDGRSKSYGAFQFGSLEASYEIDSLNLLTVGANIFNGNMTQKTEQQVAMTPADGVALTPYQYKKNMMGKPTFGGTDVNVDYQHNMHKKDETLTVSYRFSNTPNDSKTKTFLSDTVDYPYASGFPKWNVNDAYTNEHTLQVDYTTPLFKGHTLEAGLKYILRQNNSNTKERILDAATGGWVKDPASSLLNDFKHRQQIYSAYLAYAIRYKKFGFKAGLRAEGTALKVKYADAPEENFSDNMFNLVPSATVSYRISTTQQLRLGYNMRISRPGIWYLSPYVDNSNPYNISYGNPNLEAEKSHGLNLNYSLFTAKVNFNANLSYRFVNNAIQSYTFVDENGINNTTYANMGHNQNTGLFLYGRYSPVKFFNISLNGGINYTDLQGTNGTEAISNSGFAGRLFANAQFSLPKDFAITLNGGYFTPSVQLQGQGSSFYFHGISLNKSFLKKRLTIAIYCNSPFVKNQKYTNTTEGDTFRQYSVNYQPMRDFRFRVSYRFGTLKGTIKKVKRSISNDDLKSGGSSTGSTQTED